MKKLEFTDWIEVTTMPRPRNWLRELKNNNRKYIGAMTVFNSYPSNQTNNIVYEVGFLDLNNLADKYFSIYEESNETKAMNKLPIPPLFRFSKTKYDNLNDIKNHIDQFLNKLDKLEIYF